MNTEQDSGTYAIIGDRLRTIARAVDRELPSYPPAARTPPEQHDHLLEEAKQLYDNELSWEEKTGEESTDIGVVAALVFPGTLALMDALLSSQAQGEDAESGDRRDVVASFARHLATRLFQLRSGQSGGSATERAKQVDLTDRLLDLVLYRYCGLSGEEIERLDSLGN